ncbi:MAG: LysR substrate-binding domain-containing protein [Pseudomonadales bacterium]
MPINPLPPLNSLVAFEATARSGSFTAAGLELNVTQGAISRQIRLLEDYLKQELFSREQRQIQLTTIGRSYYKEVEMALGGLSEATLNVLDSDREDHITVATTSAMASFWLIPRYGDFQNQNPNINIRIITAESRSQIRNSEYDIGLFYSRVPPDDADSIALFSEQVFPVCSPEYLEKFPDCSDHDKLCEARMLNLEIDTKEWMDWREWLTACNLPAKSKRGSSINMTSYPLIIQAALNGQGVALAWSNLVDSYLNSGLLVQPVTDTLATAANFYMISPLGNRPLKPGAEAFRQWLLESATAHISN